MKRWPLFAVTFVAVLLVAVMALRERSEPGTELPPELAEQPDLYMQGSTITQFDADGSVRYRLMADQIRHFTRDDTTRLETPELTVHRPDEPPWSVRANHGYLRPRGLPGKAREEVVYLREDVVLEQRNDDKHRVKLTTEALYVYPERRFAETDRAVMIETDAGRTTAVGLAGNLGTGLLQLSSNDSQRVHTIVLPNQFKLAR